MPSAPVRPIAIYSPDGPTLRRIVITDDAIQEAHQAGCEVIDTHTPADLLLEMAPAQASNYMDAQTWQALAPIFKEAAETMSEAFYTSEGPAVTGLPPVSTDFPAPLVQDRMDTLSRVFDCRYDLESWVDLQEVAFARQTGREVNVNVLSDDARASSWDTVYEEDINDLEDQLDTLVQAHERNPGNPLTDRGTAIRALEASELDYAIETRLADEPGLALG